MKKWILIILTILLAAGLYFRFSEKESSKKAPTKVEEKIAITPNDIYKQPQDPTKYEAQVYNKLSGLLSGEITTETTDTSNNNEQNSDENQSGETPTSDQQTTETNDANADNTNNDEQALAVQVAKSFACDLFTLTSEDFAAPTSYVLKENREDFEKYAKSVILPNYRDIVEEYGEDALPQVKNIKVDTIEKTTDNTHGEMYSIALQLEYKASDVNVAELKTFVTVKLVKDKQGNWFVLSVK